MEYLRDIGLNIVSLATNHSYDCGFDGYRATQENLETLGIHFFGEEKREKSIVYQTTIRGQKIAFVGINDVQSIWDKKEISQKIQNLKSLGNHVIVVMNWGQEYALEPTERQREVGHFLVDVGANFVIGAHPHVVEGTEIYKGVPIVYSLGNFFFDQPFENTLKGQGVVWKMSPDGKVSYDFIEFTRNPKTFALDCSTFK